MWQTKKRHQTQSTNKSKSKSTSKQKTQIYETNEKETSKPKEQRNPNPNKNPRSIRLKLKRKTEKNTPMPPIHPAQDQCNLKKKKLVLLTHHQLAQIRASIRSKETVCGDWDSTKDSESNDKSELAVTAERRLGLGLGAGIWPNLAVARVRDF